MGTFLQCLNTNLLKRSNKLYLEGAKYYLALGATIARSGDARTPNNDKCYFKLSTKKSSQKSCLFLSSEKVDNVFASDTTANMPVDNRVSTFLDYLFYVHIDENSTFPSKIWTEKLSGVQIMTNVRESFHAKLNKSFYTTSNTFIVFECYKTILIKYLF